MIKTIGAIMLYLMASLAVSAQGKVKIHCTFSSPLSDSCALIPSVYYIDEYEKSYSAKISDNRCEFDINVTKPTIARLVYNRKTIKIFIEPGDELSINMREEAFVQLNSASPVAFDYEGISFSGKDSIRNVFLKNFYRQFHDDYEKTAIGQTILNSDVDAFEANLYDERKKQLNFYNNYKDKNSFSDSFRKYIENTIKYNYYAQLLSYPIIQANQSTQILSVKAFPNVMLEGIDSKLMNDEALNCEAYRDFLYYNDIYFTSAANGYNKFTDLSISMESKVNIASKNFSGQSLIWFIASYLNDNVDKVSQYTAQHVYEVLRTKENNGPYSQLLKNKVDARLAKKEVATAATSNNAGSEQTTSKSNFPKLKDIDGKYFTFDDLKGKVVYVDYWASWCGPCRQQMPFSKQLHEMFTAQQLKQIVFLYISIDQSEDAWKSGVQQIGMEGKLGISPGNWNSEIARYFQINSIPRYMLIDKKGNIVDFNAKRPSSGTEIYNDILKLLE